MITIFNEAELRQVYRFFSAWPSTAIASCHIRSEAWTDGDVQEWSELGEINGAPAEVFFLFENCVDKNPRDFSRDVAHVALIRIGEKDALGEWDL